MTNEPLLSRELLERALGDLDSRLRRRGLTADVFVFGGAAMVLGFDARPATRDVDAVWEPHTAVLEEAWATASEFGLPRSWLNDQASAYLPPGVRRGDAVLFRGAGLRVTMASAELLLAMKVRAARRGDLNDIRFLADRLGLSSAMAVLSMAETIFNEPVPARQRMTVEDLFDQD